MAFTSAELTSIYKAHRGLVERQALRILRDPSLAQDIAQEVFIQFIKYSDKVEVEKVVPLLYRMATQMAVRRLMKKANSRMQLTEREPVDDAGGAARIGEWLLFKKFLAAVDEVQAEIAAYYFLHGMSQLEISELTGIPQRTVSRHLEKFIQRGRNLVEAKGPKAVEDATLATRASR